MSGHTPGPWSLVPRTTPKDTLMIAACLPNGAEPLVCCMEYSRNSHIRYEEAEKNSALVCAAPEMLEALKDLQRQYAVHPDAFWDWSKARAAIAKATGGQP